MHRRQNKTAVIYLRLWANIFRPKPEYQNSNLNPKRPVRGLRINVSPFWYRLPTLCSRWNSEGLGNFWALLAPNGRNLIDPISVYAILLWKAWTSTGALRTFGILFGAT